MRKHSQENVGGALRPDISRPIPSPVKPRAHGTHGIHRKKIGSVYSVCSVGHNLSVSLFPTLLGLEIPC
jgi:hypothetical protein